MKLFWGHHAFMGLHRAQSFSYNQEQCSPERSLFIPSASVTPSLHYCRGLIQSIWGHLREKNRARCVSMTTQRDVLSCKTWPLMHLSASTTNQPVKVCHTLQSMTGCLQKYSLQSQLCCVETLICCLELNIGIFRVLALQKTCYVYDGLQTVGLLTHHVMSLYISSIKNSGQNSDVEYVPRDTAGCHYGPQRLFIPHLTH